MRRKLSHRSTGMPGSIGLVFHLFCPNWIRQCPVTPKTLLLCSWRLIVSVRPRRLPTTSPSGRPFKSHASWTICFSRQGDTPQGHGATRMTDLYKLALTRDAEVLYRYCELAIAAEDDNILPTVTGFITTQGRRKFTRPL